MFADYLTQAIGPSAGFVRVCVCTLRFCWFTCHELSSFICTLLNFLYHDTSQVILRVFGVIVEGHHVSISILYFAYIFTFVIIKFCCLSFLPSV